MSHPQVSIVSAGHDISDARLHRHVAALLGRGLSVEVVALGDPDGAPAGAMRVETVARAGHAARLLRARAVTRSAVGRVVVTLDPDVLALASVRGLHRRGRLLVADVHEDYEALLGDRSWARGPAGFVGRLIARRAVRRAQLCDLVCVADDHLLPDVPKRIVVRNVPTLPLPCERDPSPRAVYVGDIRASRGAFAMLDAIEDAPDWTLDLVGPIAAEDAAAMQVRLARLAGRVRWHDRQPPERAWEIASGAWVGLALLDDTPAFREATPSKLYEYAAYGMVMVASDLPGHRRLRDELGAGVILDDPSGAATELMHLSQSPDATLAMCRKVADAARALPVFAEGSERLADALVQLVGGDNA